MGAGVGLAQWLRCPLLTSEKLGVTPPVSDPSFLLVQTLEDIYYEKIIAKTYVPKSILSIPFFTKRFEIRFSVTPLTLSPT